MQSCNDVRDTETVFPHFPKPEYQKTFSRVLTTPSWIKKSLFFKNLIFKWATLSSISGSSAIGDISLFVPVNIQLRACWCCFVRARSWGASFEYLISFQTSRQICSDNTHNDVRALICLGFERRYGSAVTVSFKWFQPRCPLVQSLKSLAEGGEYCQWKLFGRGHWT